MKWHKTITKSIPLALMLINTSSHSQTTRRSTPGSGAGDQAGRATVPQLGEYIELDEALKNEMYGTIDFPNAELTTIIKAISKLANKNFILDNKVQNHRVTIVSPVAVSKQDAYNAFLSALYMNNLTIVSAGKFLKVVEAKTAYAENTRVFVGDYAPATEEVVTVLYPLKNLNADDINRFVVDLVPRTGRVITFPDTNTIVMTTSGLILRRVISILKAVDVPGHQDQLESIPINHASAKQIAELLDEILEAQGGSNSRSRTRRRSSRTSSTQKTRGGGIITKIVPDERTNSLVVLANGRGIAELKQLISKLDTPSIAGSGNIHIYYCKNAESEALAQTLSNLIQAQKTDQPKRDGATNLPVPPRNTRNNNSNEDAVGGVQLGGNVRVTADKATNSLVILASASDFAALKQVLTKLDLPRRQVYVEATIMEVKVSDDQEFGVGVNIAADNIGQVGGFIPSTITQKDFQSIVNTPAALSGLVAGIATGRTVTLQGSGTEINSVIGLIRAIEDNAQGQILHQPQILISDNEEAEINVVDKIPVPKKENVAIGNTTQVNETFEKEEIKISLKITPQIGEDNNLVRLKVEQKVDDFSPSSQGQGQLVVTERSANTSVTVQDGSTVVIGGLQKRENKDVRSKFPILGDLPILGWLFKGSNSTETRSQLILFLKPRIIEQYSDLLNLTKNKLDTRKQIGKGLDDPKDRHKEEIEEFIETNKKDIERNDNRGWGLKKTSRNSNPIYDKGDSFSSDERLEGVDNKSVSDLESEINAIEESLNQPEVTAQAPANLDAAPFDDSPAPPLQEPGPELIPSFEGDE